MTWVILVWCIVMAIWIVGGALSADSAQDCAGEAYREACEAGSDVGTGVAVIALWFIWFFGFIALSLIWFMSRPKGRECPACGENVKRGKTECPSCQFDLAGAARQAA